MKLEKIPANTAKIIHKDKGKLRELNPKKTSVIVWAFCI
ncbi:hypothetical protein GM3709_3037 [Geminocystis sp. NIES-3709]|nr:hypothetical protein GM3709_3037 [Geminocystis sp. NIES-3709]